MTRKIFVTIFLLLALMAGSAAAQSTARPQFVSGQRLIALYGVSNGDAVIVSARGNWVYFTVQYADGREPDEQRLDWPLDTAPDRIEADVCGNVIHVAAQWDQWDGVLYTLTWTIPIEYRVVLPIICRGSGP